ncbi:MAG: 3-keto-disaccharide hydrolase [Planctomycetota bacterium]
MGLGYQDTPMIPGTNWHVHDGERPQPPVVEPTNLGEIGPVWPPGDAVVLFDGSDLDEWESQKGGGPAGWEIVGDAMRVVPGAGGIRTKRKFGDIQLHVEWAAPAEVKGESQGRGNSGVFLMESYEIQVLDCYRNPTYPDGSTGAIYGQYPPLANACAPPGEWNTYDVIWEAPVFDGDEVEKPAYLTVLHNGVLLHNHVELMGQTGHKTAPSYAPHPPEGSIALQDHGDLVRYRDIWVRELKGYDQG